MNAIAAINKKRTLGKNGALMYNIREDMRYFASVTAGKTVIMGKKTLDGFPGGKALKNRNNILLSRSISESEAESRGVTVVRSLNELLATLIKQQINEDDIFVIGGGEVYKMLLPYCHKLYLTEIDDDAVGDAFFPEFDRKNYILTEGELHTTENGLNYRFNVYESNSVSAFAPAKLNLGLWITGEKDGYHLIDTIMQGVDLGDTVTVTKQNDGLFTSNIENDNAIKAAKLLSEHFGLGGFDIFTNKQIPIGSGLGGSSADVAAVIRAICVLTKTPILDAISLVKNLYSDLPFMFTMGTARCTGIGDNINILTSLPKMTALILPACTGVDTKAAYSLSKISEVKPQLDELYAALSAGEKATNYFFNALTDPAKVLNKEISPNLDKIKDDDAILYGMTGSGSCVFALYTDESIAKSKVASLPSNTILCHTI